MVDDVEWMGAKEGAPIEESRFHWLCVPLLAVAAHGGPDPTGPTTQRWTETLTMLRHARVVECESLVVELVVDDEPIAEHRPPAWWLAGDVLAVKREVGTKYEVLAPALESMLGRQNLHKDLLLVLGAVGGAHVPSTDTIQAALSRAEIDSSSLDDVRSYWVGSVGLIAARVRPVAELLGTAMDGFDDAAFDIDRLTDWLRESVPSWDAQQLVAAARRSRDDGAMGAEAWRALGGVAQLPEWNAVLDRLGSEYEPVINENLNEQVDDHVEALRPLLKAVARYAAIEAGNPSLFGKVDLLDLAMPSDWSTRWWHVPLSAVLAVVRRNCKDVGVGVEIRRLLDAGTIDGLREALVERGVEVDVDPYEVARTNREALAELTREVDDLYRAWLEFRTPGSKVPSPTAPEIDSEAFLHIWTPDDLWCRALEKVGDEQFKIACGAVRGPNEARKQLRLSEQEVEQRRAERVQSEKAARTRKATIAGRTYEAETIDYAELLKDHVTRLEEPVGPHAKYDEFTPLGTPPKRGNPGGAGPTTKRPRRKPSSTDPEIIGAIGELHAYRYLRKEFGGRAVQARAWVSETRLKAIPLVEGERHNTSDGHGFDFRFSHEGTKWCVEVKATPGDETSFELGISEIRAATGVARLAKPKLKWRILRVRQCLSEHPQFDWLPNPFEDGFRSHFQLREGGMMVSYVRDS